VKSETLKCLGLRPVRGLKPLAVASRGAFAVGGLLVLWSAFIHFHLWDEAMGYRHISVIGPLFLLQSIGGLLLGIAVVVVRRVWIALAGIGFALSTALGFLLAVELPKGLFSFKESWSAPFAVQALAIEVAIMVVLLVAGTLCVVAARAATSLSPVGADQRRDRPRV
jgi:hypothetical protein